MVIHVKTNKQYQAFRQPKTTTPSPKQTNKQNKNNQTSKQKQSSLLSTEQIDSNFKSLKSYFLFSLNNSFL